MKTIKISDYHFRLLLEMCKNYYVVKGDTPKSVNFAVEKLIEDDYEEYSPSEYQTTGFDRQ